MQASSDHYMRVIAPLIYRVADKFFKFVSWAIIITVLQYTQLATNSRPVQYLYGLAMWVFVVSLMTQAFYVMVRDPADWNIPPHLRKFSMVMQFVAGLLILLICASPYLVLDTIIADLARTRLP